jgi:hypothetical protein
VPRGSSPRSVDKPGRDGGGEEGRFAVPREGGGEVGGRQPSHRGSSRNRHHGGGRIFIHGGWYDPWYYYGPGWGWGWSWRGWWWPWGPAGVYYDGPYNRGHRGSGYGALDVDIWPGDTEIYVDGQLTGTADDFDGFPSYLWLPRGTYDVVFYRPGFETLARQYSIYDGLVIDVNDRLERGEAVRPEDLPSRSTVNRDERIRRNAEREEAARRREEWRRRHDDEGDDDDYEEDELPAATAPPVRPELERGRGDAARVHLDVTPDDASVYLDGNFLGTAAELEQLSAGLVVTAGSHRLEVVRPGYEPEEVDFDGRPGDDVRLRVELEQD